MFTGLDQGHGVVDRTAFNLSSDSYDVGLAAGPGPTTDPATGKAHTPVYLVGNENLLVFGVRH